MKKVSILGLLLCLLLNASTSGQVGKVINDFKLTDAKSKKEVALSDYSGKQLIAVIFTSNYCPYSKLYEERILALHDEFSAKGLQLILINPNDPVKSKNDTVEKMAEKAKEKGYPFPYLADKDQIAGKLFGATKTPEVFLLKKKNGSFNIVYSGAIDDNPQVPQDVNTAYVNEAILALLANKNPVQQHTRPTGCIIKKN